MLVLALEVGVVQVQVQVGEEGSALVEVVGELALAVVLV